MPIITTVHKEVQHVRTSFLVSDTEMEHIMSIETTGTTEELIDAVTNLANDRTEAEQVEINMSVECFDPTGISVIDDNNHEFILV